MKAMNFLPTDAPRSFGALLGLGRFPTSLAPTPSKDRPGLAERFDRWLWKQHVKEREAYLADAQDIFDLEERMRRLERSVGSRYY